MSQARHQATDCFSPVSRHQETGCIKFQSGFNLSKRTSLVNLLDSHNVVVEQPAVESKKTPDDMRVMSKRPNTSKPTGRDNIFTHFPQLRIVKYASSQRLPELRAGTARMHEETESIFGDVVTADHKVQWRKRISFATSLRSRDADSLFWLDSKLNEEQNRARNNDMFVKIRAARSKTGIIHTDIRWSLSALVKTHIGITRSQHQTDQKPTELSKTQFTGSKKVPLLFWISRVCKKSGGDKRWNAYVICQTCKTNW